MHFLIVGNPIASSGHVSQKLLITSEESIPIQLDGDFAGWHSTVVIRMEPARIPIIC